METINTPAHTPAMQQEEYIFDDLKLVAKLDVPDGMRVCRIIHKGKDSAGKAAVSVGSLVPDITDEQLDELINTEIGTALFKEALIAAQDKLVRAALGDTSRLLGADNLSTDTLLAFIAAMQEEKKRVSKEVIEEWFVRDLQPLLIEALKGKGITQAKQLADTCTAFKTMLASLSGRTPSMSQQAKQQCEKAMLLLPDDYSDPVAEFIAGKLLVVSEATAVMGAL